MFGFFERQTCGEICAYIPVRIVLRRQNTVEHLGSS